MWNTSHGLLHSPLVRGYVFLTIFLPSPVGNTNDFTGSASFPGHHCGRTVPSGNFETPLHLRVSPLYLFPLEEDYGIQPPHIFWGERTPRALRKRGAPPGAGGNPRLGGGGNRRRTLPPLPPRWEPQVGPLGRAGLQQTRAEALTL